MKILELRFKNLNSLYGEWVIDFTDPEYVSNGIFALTGPTGSGKSTILDAICLALYGATPRLGKITQSRNEIMSRQTGECYAEVVFESQAGRFRCHWSQHRARKKPDGKLADAKHEISDVKTGKPIETKKSLVVGVIEEKTGIDFDRFTRSILLAQGGFDTFLKADEGKKSKILEQITGTEIYTKISCRVHERNRDERDKLNLLQAETSGIMILEMEQEKEIQRDLETKQKQEINLADKSTETSKAIVWLTSIDGLKNELSNLAEEAVKLQGSVEAFKPERDKLDRAMQAADLGGSHATLKAIREQQSNDQATLKFAETNLPDLESSANRQAEALKLAEQQTTKSKEELKTAAPLIREVSSLDLKLTEQKKDVSEKDESRRKDAAKIDADKQAQLKEQKKQTEAKKNLGLVNDYRKKHAQDEWLISGLTGVEEQLGTLLSKQKEIAQKKADVKKAETSLKQALKKLDDSTKQSGVGKNKLEGASKKLQLGKDNLSTLLGDRLLREYRTDKETLLRELTFLSTIAELKDHRNKLEDGKPCPLCGAKTHPFAEGNIPTVDPTEKKINLLTALIDKAEDLETANKKLEKAEAAARKNLTDSEKLEATALDDKKAADKSLAELKDGLENLLESFTKLKQEVFIKLQPLGITEIPDKDIPSLLKSLKLRLNAWQDQIKKKAQIDEQLAGIDSEIKRLDAIIETQSTALSEKQERFETLKKEYAAGRDKRMKLYGDKKPDDEETRLNKVVEAAEATEKKTTILNTELQHNLTIAKTNVASLKEHIEQRKPKLTEAETDFLSALEPTGFSDEKQFLEAILTNEVRATLSTRAKKLENAQTELKARQKDRATRLATEVAQEVTDKNLEELKPQLKQYEESLKELRDAIAGFKHKLSENAAAKERVKEKQSAIEAQKKECHRWEKLHGLIGSSDGKKYRNFAQGLTFELMVSHANRQLEKMTDRYLLIRDEQQPLELNVIDNYQAGEIRSTRNLSGGESFIVSLTLALGLSRMASRKVRVDSLFLDEGFGTLDEEALEASLETLSGLQQDGKLIGIISHVSALKERISTQITIKPVSGGRSTITGPGCNKASGHADG